MASCDDDHHHHNPNTNLDHRLSRFGLSFHVIQKSFDMMSKSSSSVGCYFGICFESFLSLTLREERMRMSENRVLRRIFGPNREEVAGD
jgi:hypothetical protein